jgi:hypothetical protein
VTQVQPGENKNTFHNLGETVSQLKLTAYQAKSIQTKSLISAPTLALWAEGAAHCSHTSYSTNGSGETASSNKITLTAHYPQE